MESGRTTLEESIGVATGYRFNPKDDVVLEYYVKPKLLGQPMPYNFIPEADVYGLHPQQLATFLPMGRGGEDWWFFASTRRKDGSPKVAVRSSSFGRWKASVATKEVRNDQGQVVGTTQGFKYEEFGGKRKKDSIWLMEEFAVKSLRSEGAARDHRLDDWVVCKLYLTPNARSRTSGVKRKATDAIDEVPTTAVRCTMPQCTNQVSERGESSAAGRAERASGGWEYEKRMPQLIASPSGKEQSNTSHKGMIAGAGVGEHMFLPFNQLQDHMWAVGDVYRNSAQDEYFTGTLEDGETSSLMAQGALVATEEQMWMTEGALGATEEECLSWLVTEQTNLPEASHGQEMIAGARTDEIMMITPINQREPIYAAGLNPQKEDTGSFAEQTAHHQGMIEGESMDGIMINQIDQQDYNRVAGDANHNSLKELDTAHHKYEKTTVLDASHEEIATPLRAIIPCNEEEIVLSSRGPDAAAVIPVDNQQQQEDSMKVFDVDGDNNADASSAGQTARHEADSMKVFDVDIGCTAGPQETQLTQEEWLAALDAWAANTFIRTNVMGVIDY